VQDLWPSQTGIITTTGILNDVLTAGIFTNTATITSATADIDTSNNQSEAGSTIILPPALTITKTVTTVNDPVQPGNVITYTIVVANRGGGEAIGAHITDTLPTYITGSNLDEIVTVEANKQVTFTLKATLDAGAPYKAIITNTAYYSYLDDRGEATTNFIVAGPPQLTIAKTAELRHNPPYPGDPLTYTISLINNGASRAVGVVISDPLPPYIKGTNLYRIINLAAGESLTFTLPVSLASDVPFGETIINTVSFSHASGSGRASFVFSVKEAKKIYLPIIQKN
jgi:uncharacterized repeat protein (TIGR01451 family)